MEQIDLSEIQELLDDILGGTVDFQQLVEQGTSGQSILSWGGILHNFGTIFLQELVMLRCFSILQKCSRTGAYHRSVLP